MTQLGYLRDILALPLFLLLTYKIYNINNNYSQDVKKELLIYLVIAFIADFVFSIYPDLHCINLGYNFYSYFLFFMCFLVAINFIYFNKKLFI